MEGPQADGDEGCEEGDTGGAAQGPRNLLEMVQGGQDPKLIRGEADVCEYHKQGARHSDDT